MRFAIVLFLALAACGGGNSNQPPPTNPADVPLPPASGTPIGYLIDSSGELQLRDDQLAQLKDLDSSLAAQDADIDVQIRQIEKPEDEEQLTPQEQKAHVKQQRYNMAPGQNMKTTPDSQRLHAIRDQNDRAAITKAWALLGKDQQVTAKRILEGHGVEVPGDPKSAPKTNDDGTPLPGMDQ
ncbi:MAG TPA: hypothetical protein VGL61_00095 [Kofleriaceae bacterium]|jgi:hypothetical protein